MNHAQTPALSMLIRSYLPLLILLVVCTCGRAQIVNIEDKRKALDSLGWHGQVDLNGSLTKNNNTVVTAGGSLRLDRLGKKGNVLFLSSYRLVQVSGKNALNSGFSHLRYGYEPKDRWRLETFAQIQYNEQLRLSLRFLMGAGIRRRLYKNNGSRAYLGVLYMYEYDELVNSDIFYRDHRLSNYFTVNIKLSKSLSLANTTYYQPRLPEFNLARVSTVANLALAISNRLRFTTKFSLTHDARVARDLPDVPATTYKWVNGVRWTFN